MANSQQFSLRWNNYLSHIRGAFDTLRADEDLVDVTLSCEGKRIKAHKMLLSACSPYFREIFKENPCQHPVIVFHHVKYDDLEALVTFMYQGEVNVAQESLSSFLNTAEVLEVQGLTGGSKAPFETSKEDDEQTETDSESKSKKQNVPKIVSPVLQYPDSPPNKKRKQNSGIEVNQQSCEDMKLESGALNVEAEYYDNDSTEPYDEPTSCSEAFLQEALTERGYTCPGEDSGEGLSSLDRGAGTSSEGVLHDSLQVFAHGLWRRLHPSLKQFGCDECGKVFKHPRSLDHHKKMHEGRTTCPVCRRVFGRMYALRLHMSSSHPDHSDLHLHKPKGCLNPLH